MQQFKNKRGQMTMFLIMALFGIFLLLIGILVVGIISTRINSALDQNITVGQVNLATESAKSIGKFNEMVINSADFWGIAVIFGMVIGLFLSSYFMRSRFPKVGIILDIFMILIAFIFSLYIRAVYSSVVVALADAGEAFATTYMTKSNFFILNLPIFVSIVGVVMMILFHTNIPRKAEEINTFPGVVTG